MKVVDTQGNEYLPAGHDPGRRLRARLRPADPTGRAARRSRTRRRRWARTHAALRAVPGEARSRSTDNLPLELEIPVAGPEEALQDRAGHLDVRRGRLLEVARRRWGSRAWRRAGSRGTPITASQPPRVSEPSAISRDRIARAAPPATTNQYQVVPDAAAGGEHRADRGHDQARDRQAERVEDDQHRAQRRRSAARPA